MLEGILEGIWHKVDQRLRQHAEAKADDLRGYLIKIADQELGIAKADAKICDKTFAELLEEAGMSRPDARASVDNYKRCKRWSELAVQEPKLFAEAQRLEAAANASEGAEWRRHLAEQDRIRTLHAKASQALAAYATAQEAGLKLTDNCEPPDDDTGLSTQLTDLGWSIGEMRGKKETLKSRIAQTRSELGAKTRSLTEAKRIELEKQLSGALSAVEGCDIELARLEKERQSVHAKIKAAADKAARPENFKLIRRRSSNANQASLVGAAG